MKNLLQTPWHAPSSRAARWLVAVLMLGAVPAWAQGAPGAGKLLMSIGSVTLVRDGKESPAPRDTVIQAGDMLRTGASSNAQIKLNDGGLIAVRPNSEFKIAAFNYNGKNDGSESASLNLLKGGVRAVTGAIGRANKDNLKVDAVVATIGIRGTGFNIVLCEEACRAGSPGVKGGLYAGVFEGRIAVSNQSGSVVEMGVNQFVHVADAQSAPARLVAPPALLKDSLEGQRQVKPTTTASGGGATAASAETQRSADKAPVQAPASAGDLVNVVSRATAVSVSAVTSPPPAYLPAAVPTQFYDLPGLGDQSALQAPVASVTYRSFQSAEFNPNGTQRRADNQVLQGVGDTVTLGFTQYDGYKLQSVAKNSVDVYAIRNAYTATQTEGGSDGGVIAWGRWSGGSALVGNYGAVSYTGDQGFHWIAGNRLYSVPTEIRNQSFTFNLIGATRPTEAVAGAEGGWRVYGGNMTANFGSTNVGVNGVLNLYLQRASGSGNFNMNFSGTSDANSIAYTRVNASVVRVLGDTNLCASSCAGAGVVSFYGSQASRAGLTYEFNTGASYVQGAAAFRR